MSGFFTRWRRARCLRKPAPAAWNRFLSEQVSFYPRLPPADQAALLQCMQVLLAEKHFEACGGFEMTDAARLTIAAHASLPLLRRPAGYYPRLDTVLVYPDTFEAPDSEPMPGGVVAEFTEEKGGESWADGVVILSWAEIGEDRELADGQNVIIHEFTHQLDMQDDGVPDGSVPLPAAADHREWARVFSREFRRLQRDVRKGRQTVLDDYGATDPAEFLAVVTEAFFERPRELRVAHPELYTQLQRCFRQDPAREWRW